MSQTTRICLGSIFTLIAMFSLAVAAPTGEQRGDLDGDGIINTVDVILLINHFFYQVGGYHGMPAHSGNL